MSELRLQIPDKMEPFLRPCRHKIARGGRGSAKSHSIAQLLVAKLYEQPKRWLCTREVQKSLRYSVHSLLADTITRMGLRGFYDVQRETIKGANGSEFIFSGLREHSVESIKSFENCDGAWVEEASAVSASSANVLIPTIRKPNSEIWWSYNPDQDDDYVHKMEPGDDTVIVELNWRDNPWFPEVLEKERLKLKAINDDLYQHVWEGKCRSKAGLLFKRRWFKQYDVLPSNLQFYMAADYAGARDLDSDREPDYNELGIVGLDQSGDWYFIDWWAEQVEDPDEMIRAGARLVKKHKPLVWFEEKGPILRSLDPIITRRLREEHATVYRNALASASSKAERALGFAAVASTGRVHFPNTAWADRVVNQLCAFTGEDGKQDDSVDVCSLMARGLDLMSNARTPPKPEQPAIVPFTRSHFEAGERQEKRERDEKQRYYR